MTDDGSVPDRLPTVGYLISTHHRIDQVHRLVDAILAGDPEGRVYISHDAGGDPGIERLAGDRVHVETTEGGRGGFSQVRRVLSLIDTARRDADPDFMITMSGEDYPCRPLSELRSALAASGDGLMEAFEVFDPSQSHWPRREGAARYLYSWRTGPRLAPPVQRAAHLLHAVNRVQPWIRLNVAYGNLSVGVRRSDGIPAGLTCYGGSSWWALSRRCLAAVTDIVAARPDVVSWAESSRNIDEAIFQTLTCSSPEFRIVARSPHYFDFADTHFGHPRYLTVEDLPAILASGAFLCRKVASATLMNELDGAVAGQRLTGRER